MAATASSVAASSSSSSKSKSTAAPRHFDISQLPSLKDGMSAEEESKTRRKTCRFIEEAGRILKLPRVAVATAMVFFHRFYAKHSFNQHDRFEVAVASVVLAGKTEESPKKLANVIDECYKLKQKGMQAGRISAGGGGTPPAPLALDPKGEEFMKLKERILLLERVILHTIGFELSIDHPYKFLVDQIKKITHTRQLEYISQQKSTMPTQQMIPKMVNELVQYSMNFANDSMHTSLCLQFSAQLIATSCVYLAGHFAKVRPVNQKSWIQVLGNPDTNAIVSIGFQIIDCIADRKNSSDSNETFAKIRNELEKLKDPSSGPPPGGPPPPPRRPPPGGPPPPPPSKRQRT